MKATSLDTRRGGGVAVFGAGLRGGRIFGRRCLLQLRRGATDAAEAQAPPLGHGCPPPAVAAPRDAGRSHPRAAPLALRALGRVVPGVGPGGLRGVVELGVVRVAAPLPDIARHAAEAEGRFTELRVDGGKGEVPQMHVRVQLPVVRAEHQQVLVRRSVPPGEVGGLEAAGRVLPLGLCGQEALRGLAVVHPIAAIGPEGVGVGTIPGDHDHRPPLRDAVLQLPDTLRRALQRHVGLPRVAQPEANPVCHLLVRGPHAVQETRVGTCAHGLDVHEKAAQGDPVARLLVGQSGSPAEAIPDPDSLGGDQDAVHAVGDAVVPCVLEVRIPQLLVDVLLGNSAALRGAILTHQLREGRACQVRTPRSTGPLELHAQAATLDLAVENCLGELVRGGEVEDESAAEVDLQGLHHSTRERNRGKGIQPCFHPVLVVAGDVVVAEYRPEDSPDPPADGLHRILRRLVQP
mmetsp:Transcript_26622/g.79495  ORF Transcript_26622/g.79495 Transcript_26622/m.79495 type:complete len:462 (-) Transcript_26622:114-1499(-)